MIARMVSLIVVLTFTVVAGCSAPVDVHELDKDGDGEVELWFYKREQNLLKTEIDLTGDGQANRVMSWGKDGRLLLDETRRKGTDKMIINKYYHHQWKKYDLNGNVVWRNSLDVKKSYPKQSWSHVGKVFTYTVDNVPIFAEMDVDADGDLDRTIFYDNYKQTDKPPEDLIELVQKIKIHVRSGK